MACTCKCRSRRRQAFPTCDRSRFWYRINLRKQITQRNCSKKELITALKKKTINFRWSNWRCEMYGSTKGSPTIFNLLIFVFVFCFLFLFSIFLIVFCFCFRLYFLFFFMMRSQRLLQGWHNVIYLRHYFGWLNQPSSGLDVIYL